MLIDVPIVDLTGGATGRFYTYVYRDVRVGFEGLAIYVGKGTENPKYGKCGRAVFHWTRRSSSRGLREILKAIHAAGLEPVIEIVGRFETEAAAFQHEAELIARFGRRDLGLGALCNLSDGGEGPSGFLHTLATKEKIGVASKKMHEDRERAFRRAAKISAALSRPDTKLKRAQIMREVHARPGDKERRTTSQRAAFSTAEHKVKRAAATHASHAQPKTKEKHSQSLRVRWSKPGAKDQQSDRLRRLYDNPAHKQKHIDAVRAYFASSEYAAKMAAKITSRAP